MLVPQPREVLHVMRMYINMYTCHQFLCLEWHAYNALVNIYNSILFSLFLFAYLVIK